MNMHACPVAGTLAHACGDHSSARPATRARMVGDRMPDCAMARFSLTGEVSSDDPAVIGPVLAQMVGDAAITETHDGLHVEGVMDGADAREVNRQLLSALRRAEKRTRLRAEWTGGGYIYRFFDYVPKSTRAAPAEPEP